MWQVTIYPRWYSKIGYRGKLDGLGAKQHTKYRRQYWTIKTNDRNTINKQLKKLRVHTEWKQTDWVRASNCRDKFFRNYKEPYRCRYCNKLLNKDKVRVDHLIPVGRVQHSWSARLLLKLSGIKNVNDAKNLVPACNRCNLKKSDKLGIWYIKGIIGRYRIYWIIRGIIYWGMIIGAAYMMYQYGLPYFYH